MQFCFWISWLFCAIRDFGNVLIGIDLKLFCAWNVKWDFKQSELKIRFAWKLWSEIQLTYKLHNAFHSPDPHKSSRGVWSRLADDLVDTAAASRWYCHCPFREHYWCLWRAALSLWWVHWALMTTKRLKETVIEVWFDAGWLSFHSHCPASSADCPDRCSSIGSVRRCLRRPLTASVMYYGCLDYD